VKQNTDAHARQVRSACIRIMQPAGTFTLDATDTSGNLTAHIIGVMTGTRVTTETTIPELL